MITEDDIIIISLTVGGGDVAAEGSRTAGISKDAIGLDTIKFSVTCTINN